MCNLYFLEMYEILLQSGISVQVISATGIFSCGDDVKRSETKSHQGKADKYYLGNYHMTKKYSQLTQE